jgi:hypothetical protein
MRMKWLLFSNLSPRKRCPPLCHLDRSAPGFPASLPWTRPRVRLSLRKGAYCSPAQPTSTGNPGERSGEISVWMPLLGNVFRRSVPGFPTSPLSPATTHVVLSKENHIQLTEAATLEGNPGKPRDLQFSFPASAAYKGNRRSQLDSLLFFPQCLQRIEASSPVRRQPGCRQAHQEQNRGHADEGNRIRWPDPIQHPRQQPSHHG